MQETLKLIQWPLISTNQEVLKTVPPPDVMNKFQYQFQCLGKLLVPTKQYINPSFFKPYLLSLPYLTQLLICFTFQVRRSFRSSRPCSFV